MTVSLASLRAANRAAGRFYRRQLNSPAGASAARYLHSRGATATLDNPRWLIGCAPPAWTALSDHLRSQGFSTTEQVAAGLATRSRTGCLIDVFRNRIVFGVHDLDGHVVGFIGRAPPHAPTTRPRYLNTTRTPLYKKNELLFGLWEQLPQLAAGRPVLLVEGAFDVLAITAAAAGHPGLEHVAPSGTALTPAHVATLDQVIAPTQPITVAFDGDPAGRRAAARAWELLSSDHPSPAAPGRPLARLDLPADADPSSLLAANGPDHLRRLLDDPGNRHPLIDTALDAGIEPWTDQLDTVEGRILACRAIAPIIARQPPADVPRLVARTATQLDLLTETVNGLVTDALPQVISAEQTNQPPTHTTLARRKVIMNADDPHEAANRPATPPAGNQDPPTAPLPHPIPAADQPSPHGHRDRERQSPGALIAGALLVVGLPVLYIEYVIGAAMASDACGPDDHAGICDPTTQQQAVNIPLFGWLLATAAAWLLIAALPRRSHRGWAVLACWLVAIACLLYGNHLTSPPTK